MRSKGSSPSDAFAPQPPPVCSEVLTIAESEWNKSIPKSNVLEWMKDEDIEVLSALQDIFWIGTSSLHLDIATENQNDDLRQKAARPASSMQLGAISESPRR